MRVICLTQKRIHISQGNEGRICKQFIPNTDLNRYRVVKLSKKKKKKLIRHSVKFEFEFQINNEKI
jgi:uncharacterized protein YktA (UPF0223 family)